MSGKLIYCCDLIDVEENQIVNFPIALRPFVVLEQTKKIYNISDLIWRKISCRKLKDLSFVVKNQLLNFLRIFVLNSFPASLNQNFHQHVSVEKKGRVLVLQYCETFFDD